MRSPRLRLPREEAEDTAPLVPKALAVSPITKNAAPRRRNPNLVYELNVRGYTMQHPSVQGPLRGTIGGLTTRRVIDHLKYMGVDVVEFLAHPDGLVEPSLVLRRDLAAAIRRHRAGGRRR